MVCLSILLSLYTGTAGPSRSEMMGQRERKNPSSKKHTSPSQPVPRPITVKSAKPMIAAMEPPPPTQADQVAPSRGNMWSSLRDRIFKPSSEVSLIYSIISYILYLPHSEYKTISLNIYILCSYNDLWCVFPIYIYINLFQNLIIKIFVLLDKPRLLQLTIYDASFFDSARNMKLPLDACIEVRNITTGQVVYISNSKKRETLVISLCYYNICILSSLYKHHTQLIYLHNT